MTTSNTARPEARQSFRFARNLFVLGLLITVSVVPGIFTVDENNYLINVLALRQGRVTVANTEGLPPSRELLFFDPGPWSRSVETTPVASTAPPLYAPIAFLFFWMGWRGLVALNTLAYLATTAMVFFYVKRYASEEATPWLAAGAFALGGYSIEYALGVWPHSLSVALCTGGVLAAGRLLENRSASLAAGAGFLLALATGIRYQNAIILAAVGVGIGLWAAPRWRSVATFSMAALVPLSVSSAINHARLLSWNPISKGPGYLSLALVQDISSSWTDPFVMFWARVVDYSARPPLSGRGFEGWFVHDATTGANLMLGVALKKALLQSAPWAALALMIFVLVWLPRFRIPESQRRQLRLFSLVTFAILGVFAVSGMNRDDGLSFNQRYLLELVPLAAVAFAFSLDRLALQQRPFLAGAAPGVGLVLVILFGTPLVGSPDMPRWLARQIALLYLPLFMAAALGVLWGAARSRPRVRPALAAAVGCCLGWALALHAFDDVLMSQNLRAHQRERTTALAALLPAGSALVTFGGSATPAGPLLFNRDLVILDTRADDGTDAPMLIQELLRRKRRVFLLDEGLPVDVRARVVSGLDVMPATQGGPAPLLELRERSG